MVFLTATLPKHTEPEFMRIMKIKPEEVQTFRGPTTRPNIAYSVHEYAEESDETDAICQLVREKLEQYAAPAKIIVYGGTIERTQELSKALGCQQYYREVGDRDEKGAIMGRWQRGNRRAGGTRRAREAGLVVGQWNRRSQQQHEYSSAKW